MNTAATQPRGLLNLVWQVFVSAITKNFGLHDPIGLGSVFVFRVTSFEAGDNIHAFDDAAKHRVLPIQLR